MRHRYEFALHVVADEHVGGAADAQLALLGAQGWEIRGVTSRGTGVVVALQRPLDEDAPLPDHDSLAEALAEPLAAPTERELEVINGREHGAREPALE